MRNHFVSDLPPSQGGKYSGFGYSAQPPRSQSDFGLDSWGFSIVSSENDEEY